MLLCFRNQNMVWGLLIALGLVMGGLLGWRLQPIFSNAGAHHNENDERCTYWPDTTASYPPRNSLGELFAESNLVIKGEVISRKWMKDSYSPLGDSRRPPEEVWVLHDVKVLDVINGMPTNKDVVTFGDSTRGCLEIGTVAYMFLLETSTAKLGGYIDSPNEYQNPADYTTGPQHIFPVKKDRVEPLMDTIPPESEINAIKGMRERDFNTQLHNLAR